MPSIQCTSLFLRKCTVGDANVEDMQSEGPGNLLSSEIPSLSEISAGGGMKTTNCTTFFSCHDLHCFSQKLYIPEN